MNINLQLPKLMDLRPRLTVVGVGGAGGNAVNNMIVSGLSGVQFVVANTDAQSLAASSAEHRIQLGVNLTEGLGAGARPEIGQAAAEEALEEIRAHVAGSHMVFIAAGMGGGTGTGAAAVIARIARECGALTVAVVTKPFQFEGSRRMRAAEAGVAALRPHVDTMIVIPNQNLFRIANEKTTFAEAFILADQVLYSGIACIVDLIVKEGLINLDFADVRTIMGGMGSAMMGTGEASGEHRAVRAAEEAISNPLLDDISLRGAKGLLLSITGGRDLTLYEVDEAATRVRQEVDQEANIIVGATFDDALGDRIRVSIVASGMSRADAAYVTSARNGEDAAAAYASHASASHAAPSAPAPMQMPVAAQMPVQSAIQPAAPPVLAQLQPHVAPSGAYPVPPPPDHPAITPPSVMPAQVAIEPVPYHRPTAPLSQPFPEPTSSRPPWASNGGAVFQEAAPTLSSGTAPAPSIEPSFERLMPLDESAFTAERPVEPPRGARRLPDVDDFPLVGQREYRAKSAQYAESGHLSPPSPHAGPAPRQSAATPVEPPRKLGFFERLTGARRRDPAPPAPSSHPQPKRPAPRAPSQRGHDIGTDAPSQSPHREDDPDLPVFFGGDRKSR